MGSTVLNRTCLRPTYSLRRQLIVSYGSTAVITMTIVIVLATIAAQQAGMVVEKKTSSKLEEQVALGLQSLESQTAAVFTKKFETLRGTSALLAEIVRDRIVGYPSEFADDRHVPFVDNDTGRHVYPLRGPPLPRDFEIELNWTPENLEEHTQNRAASFRRFIDLLGTESSVFFFQGNCDPADTDPSGPGYLQNCTDSNNDPTLGGVIHPVSTLGPIAEKANDISLFLKPLWEADEHAFQILVYFFNSGAGALLGFPSFGANSQVEYMSSGCEWMREINPYTGRPYGGDEEISRCRPAGTMVPLRYYNPMERHFCHDQILNPGEIRIFGPYLDGVWGQWRLSIGQAVYDRLTGEFIACTALDLNLDLADELSKSLSVNTRSEVSIVTLDGTVVAAANFEVSSATETVSLVESGFIDEETYQKLTGNRFWEGIWDGEEVKASLDANNIVVDGKLFACFPSPLPPPTFEADYKPDFWVLVSADMSDVSNIVDTIDAGIQDEVGFLIMSSLFIGLAGLVVFLAVVALVSHILTRPLNWMERTAWKIVNHTDKRVSDDLVVSEIKEEDEDPLVRCSPQTEVRQLVAEFQLMMSGFSGSGASRVAPSKVHEVRNFVGWKEDFRQFYQLNQSMEDRIKEEMSQKAQTYGRRISIKKGSRNNNSSYGPSASEIIANMSEISQVSEESASFRSVSLLKDRDHFQQHGRSDSSTRFKRPVTRTNLGSNLPRNGTFGETEQFDDNVRISRSKLFRWILCSIVLPLVLTNIVIAALVANNLLDSFPKSVEKADLFSYELEQDFLKDAGVLNSLYGEQVLPASIRDLHLLTRISGWLLFDAIPRSDSRTELEMALVEECKGLSLDEICPFDVDPSRSPCDCEWRDPWGRQCDEFSVRSRDLQRMWFLLQARDFDTETGYRVTASSFPQYDFNPRSTKWWTDVEGMPGFAKGFNVSGYETTFDRVTAASAIQSVAIPLYNHFNIEGYSGSRSSLSAYFAFEADGGYLGYAGCNYDTSRYSNFQSSDANKAYVVAPDICPLGKFGYDPRCRTWYSETKRKAVFNDGFIHVSPPYRFAAVDDVGSTASTPIVDPDTNEYIGTAALDFAPTDLFEELKKVNADFYFVISPELGEDTIVGPGHPLNSNPAAIADVVLPNDDEDSENRKKFAEIVSRMKSGESDLVRYFSEDDDGKDEAILLSFSPIYARVLRAVRPDDFGRGAEASKVLLYSLGVAKRISSLNGPFATVEQDIDASLARTTIIFVSLVAVITFFSILATAKISVAIAKPMIILLRVVQRVNSGRIEDDMPPLEGGSREVTQAYTAFSKLYKIVRMANSSFFSGELKWAHHIASDALNLFRKIGDQKAVAIACNNIGNTLVALSVEDREKAAFFQIDGQSQLKTALANFDEAIRIGTEEFEKAENDTEKADFAQQVADRHFNRAMCLLYFLDDPDSPENAKDKAFHDLLRSRDYDSGVQELLLHEKLMFKFSDVIFERLLRRIHGLSSLFSLDQTVWQVWDVNDLVEQADLMLQAAWEQENAPLFGDVGRVGRLQQLEGAVVGLEMASGKLEEASQLAMRMLVEDEYIIVSSFVIAADALLKLMREPNLTWSREAKLRTSLEFRRMRKEGKNAAIDIERCFLFCLELSSNLAETDELQQLNAELLDFYDEQCSGKDTVGIISVGNSIEGNVILKPRKKVKNEEEQRDALDLATREGAKGSSKPALPTAVNLMVSPSTSRTSDVFLIYITDGSATDANSFAKMQKQISKTSSKRTASMNLIIIALGVEDEAFKENCKNLCLATRSRHSSYLEPGEEQIGDVFDRVSSLVTSNSSSESNRIQLGITMERF